MPKRTLVPLLILATLLIVTVLLPATPWGRDVLLRNAARIADDAGYQVAWEASAGWPWRTLELTGLRVAGPGVDLTLEQARFGWFLPSLLTGELPLWIAVDGADVRIDAGGFPAAEPSDDAPARGLPFRPELRDADLRNLRLSVDDVPYTLPDLRLEDLTIGGRGERVTAVGRLATPDGALDLDAEVTLNPFRLEAEVTNADVRIARQWWDGATAGRLDATVLWTEAGGLWVRGDISDAAIDWYDLQVEDLAGPIRMDGLEIRTELSGSALGGAVAANGTVDVANRRWSAALHGTPRLDAAAEWGSPVALPENLTPHGEALVTAHAAGWTHVDVRASAQGTGTVDGRPFTLRSDDVRFASGPGLAIEAHGDGFGGRWTFDARQRSGALELIVRTEHAALGPARELDGELRYRLDATPSGTFVVTGSAPTPGPGAPELASADPAASDRPAPDSAGAGAPTALAPPPAGPAPRLTAPGERDLAQRETAFRIDGELSPARISAFVEGRAYGGDLIGAAVLAGGEVEGAVRLTDLNPWLSGDRTVELRADGPLATPALRAELRSSEPVPVPPELTGGLALRGEDGAPLDLRGSATLRLDGTTLEAIDGRFGPLALNGRFPFVPALDRSSADDAPLAWRLDPVQVGTETEDLGTVTVADGGFAPFQTGGSVLTGAATLRTAVAAAEGAGVRVAPLAADLRADLPFLPAPGEGALAPLRLELTGPTVDASLAGDRATVTLRDHPVAFAERLVARAATHAGTDVGADAAADGTLSATVTFDPRDALTTLRGDARFTDGDRPPAERIAASVEAHEAGWRAEAVLPAGVRLAGLALFEPVRAEADLDRAGTGTASVASGDVHVAAQLDRILDAAGSVRATVRTGARTAESDPPETAEAVWTRADGSVRADGRLALAPLAALAGTDARGTLVLDGAGRTADGASVGAATLELSDPLPLSADWTAGELSGTTETPVGELALSGRLAPGRPLVLRATHPWGEVGWADGAPYGSGELPAQRFQRFAVGPLPWTLEVAPPGADAPAASLLERASVRVRTPDGRAEATLRDGAPHLTLDLPVRAGDASWRLSGEIRGGATRSPADTPTGTPLEAGPWAAFDADLRLQGVRDGPERTDLTVVGPLDRPTLRGTVSVPHAARAAGLPVELPGVLAFDGPLAWSSGADDALLEATWTAGDARLEVSASSGATGFALRLTGPGLDLTAGEDGVRLAADGADLTPFLAVAGASELPAGARSVTLDGTFAVTGPLDRIAAPDAWAPDGPVRANGRLDLTAHGDADGAEGGPTEPVARLTVTGDPDGIAVDARAAAFDATASVQGTAFPHAALRIEAAHLPTGLALSAAVQGAVADGPTGEGPGAAAPTITGTVRAPAFGTDAYGLPAQEVRIEGPWTALRLTTGDGDPGLAVSPDGLAGELVLDARVAGRPHVLRVAADGPLGAMDLSARLTGPAGTVVVETVATEPLAAPFTATVTAELTPDAWPDAVRDAAVLGVTRAHGRVDATGAWSVDATMETDAGGVPLRVQANAEAEAWTTGGGVITARSAADDVPLARAEVRLRPEAVTMALDLAELDPSAWLPADGPVRDVRSEGTARATFPFGDGASGPSVAVEGSLAAHAAGRAWTALLNVHGDPTDPVGTVRIVSDIDEAVLSRVEPGAVITIQANGPDYALSGEVPTDLRAGRLDGHVGDRPVAVRIARDPDDGRGSGDAWTATLASGDANATLTLTPDVGRGWFFAVDATTEPGADAADVPDLDPVAPDLPARGTLHAVARVGADGAARLDAFDLDLVSPVPGTFALTGSAWPDTDLRGEARLGEPFTSVALALRSEAAPTGRSTHATAVWEGLEAHVRLGDAFAVEELRLDGDAASPLQGVRVAPDAGGLTWRPDDGFAGGATVEIDRALVADGVGGDEPAPDAVRATVRLAAQEGGALRLEGTAVAERAGEDLAAEGRLDATLAHEPGVAPWSGALAGDAWLRATVPGEATVASTLRLSGTPLAPRANGELTADGPVAATGTVSADRSGGEAVLEGDGLRLSARYGPDGYAADLEVDGLDLSPWAPFADDPRLDAQARVRSDPDGRPRGRIDRLALRADGVRLDGTADWNGGWTASADLDVDLAALAGGAAEGRITGPLRMAAGPDIPLTRADLSGSLRLEAVRIGEVGLDGELSLGGALPVPQLAADLRATGPVAGTLRASWSRGRVELDADLRSDRAPGGPVALNLRAGGRDGNLTADGRLTTPWGDAEARAIDDALHLVGEGGLAGARVTLRPYAAAGPDLGLELPLDPFLPATHGVLRATLAPLAPVWLAGTATGLTVADASVPDLAFTAESGTLRLVGPRDATPERAVLHADLRLAGLAWTLRANGLEVPGGVRLAADLQGDARTARGSLAAVGPEPADAWHLDLDHGPDATLLDLNGEVGGGAVHANLRRDADGWSGPLRLTGLPTPAGRLSASGDAGGDGMLPTVTLTTTLRDGPVPVRGSVALDAPDGAWDLRVDLSATPPGAEGPLEVRGRVWPALDLVIATPGTLDAGGDPFRLEASAWSGDAPWRATGVTDVHVPGGVVRLDGVDGDGAPRLELAPSAVPGAALSAVLPSDAPVPAVATVLRDGLRLDGEGTLSGSVVWRPALDADLNDLRLNHPAAEVRLSGTVRSGTVDLTGRITPARLDATGPAGAEAAPQDLALASVLDDLVGGGPLDLRASGDLAELAVTLASVPGASPSVEGRVDLAGGGDALRFRWNAPALRGELALAPGTGATGDLRIENLRLDAGGPVAATVTGNVRLRGAEAVLDAAVRGPGRITATGRADLTPFLPVAWRPAPENGGETAPGPTELSLRVAELDLASLPGVTEALPYLSGTLGAVAEIRGTRLVAQLSAPDLTLGERELPFRLEATGDLATLAAAGPDEATGVTPAASRRGVSFAGSWDRSPIQGRLDAEGVEALWTLERFPLHAAVEAWAGPIDVDTETTGVARLELPFHDRSAARLSVATERVRLERQGVVTTGRGTVRLDVDGVEFDALFDGDGTWRAEGAVTRERLAFVLEADDADATPLLGLVPVLADLGAGAKGDFRIEADGTLSAPRIEARTDGLELALAGTRYLLEDFDASLTGPDLTVRAVLTGLAPVGGRLVVQGDGALLLDPWRLEDAALDVEGDLAIPLLGELSDVRGEIFADAEGLPRLDAEARLGAPLELDGTLWPLDLRARGDGLALSLPEFFLERATADVDLTVRFDDAFRLGGRVAARDGRFALGGRAQAPRPQPGTPRAAPNPTLERFGFENLRITGRRLAFSENFGSAEFDADLRLTGTAAAPRLSGQANAVRGVFRFAGRDFQLNSGVARFEPSRGIWPQILVDAGIRFDKATVLSSALPGTRFEQPGGSTFEVRLAFEAEVTPTPGQAAPFRLDVDPVLTSDAVISVPVESGLSAGARTLTEAELLSLVTLGRLDLSEQLAGAGGVATGVARTALDSAVDLLVLAELQTALADALGLDLVQIRTTTLSSVIAGGGDDPFGVSLRLGGYLDEGLFATFELGRYADASEALSNTLALTYELGPVELDLSTRVGFRAATDLQPVPQVAAGVRYQITPVFAIEGGASLSTEEGDARFGVTIRW